MDLVLDHAEHPVAGVERIARAEARAAAAVLDTPSEVDDDAVHEARKRAKRARALVRLLRGGLPKGRRKEEDRRLRDAGRELSRARDARVLLDTLDALVAGDGALVSAEAVAPLRSVLEGRHAAARAVALGDGAAAARAADLLLAVADGPPWEAERDGEVIRAGLERSAARARDAREQAGADPSGEHLHTWRKRTKDLRHQVEVLVPVWPAVHAPLAEQLHALTDRLGEHHDLTVLREAALADGDRFGSPADRDAVLDAITAARDARAAAAFDLGARLHAEEPEALAGRLHAALLAWGPVG
jgi:CHAD domain-containing protein